MRKQIFVRSLSTLGILLFFSTLFILAPEADAQEPVSPEDMLGVRNCRGAVICPCDDWIAYLVSVPRTVDEKPGGAWSELYLVSAKTGEIRPFITGKVNISSPRFSPDGSLLAFLTTRGKKAKKQVWMIPVGGGEAAQVTSSETSVGSFRWHPSGDRIAYTAIEAKDAKIKKLTDKGYGFIYFEEDLRNNDVHMIGVDRDGGTGEATRLTENVNVVRFEFAPSGDRMAVSITPSNLIDHVYMFQKIHIMDLASGKLTPISKNEGKLGNFAISPNGKKLAYTASLDRKDHAVSQAFVIDIDGGQALNLTEPGFRGHVSRIGWKNDKTIVYSASEGVWNTLNTVDAKGGKRKVILDGSKTGIVFNFPSGTPDFKHFAFIGNSIDIPGDVFYWKYGKSGMKRLTEENPWITERNLGRQDVIRFKARDGLEIEGILIYPIDYREGQKYPLIVGVHGGPEAHYSNRWTGSYFNPAQVLAGRGYLVFFPNYRASTGYGTEFALEGYMDAAGKEFDDLADGIEHLVSKGIADPDRVGMGGGSYGGYASAWFASYYTKYVRAVCMFVGISDLISKRGTTDIPYEELYVHSGKKLDADKDQWLFAMERSPIYHAKKSRTAVLIIGGAADTRVHPSQSMEFYRRLKMNDHPAVRLVQYPGEGHGNRKQPGRIDVLYRHLQWYDWYVRDMHPIDGPMPPLMIDESYGLELE
ncbi:MAG: S9 family peptidase [Candidatus Krumholzibacteria bacterium]|nr:S9 family peptidase [Candidatus Krumholzibacteria bacterium]